MTYALYRLWGRIGAFVMVWNGEREFGGEDLVNGEHKLRGRAQVEMKRGCIGALMGEKRKACVWRGIQEAVCKGMYEGAERR
ncbi:hypothetical protein [Bartonella sp. MM73XJBT.G]|uniref:hypothetical protein n=1 Tax=Bartonella sp. MM73XJBT.G TaxID=3019097 RepID=UPI00235F3E14|nr:hypothetical protein [Bartonella sp. MM73XJBT.G]